MKEIWKDIPGYEGKYQISSKGNVKSLARNDKYCKKPETILKPFVCGSGYLEVMFKNKQRRSVKLIHRLVAEAFVNNQEGKKEVNHKDGNKLNNEYSNLEWVTPRENINHSYKTLHNKGYSRRVECVETQETFNSLKEAAEKYGLQLPLIWKCCNGKQVTTGGYHWKYKDF